LLPSCFNIKKEQRSVYLDRTPSSVELHGILSILGILSVTRNRGHHRYWRQINLNIRRWMKCWSYS